MAERRNYFLLFHYCLLCKELELSVRISNSATQAAVWLSAWLYCGCDTWGFSCINTRASRGKLKHRYIRSWPMGTRVSGGVRDGQSHLCEQIYGTDSLCTSSTPRLPFRDLLHVSQLFFLKTRAAKVFGIRCNLGLNLGITASTIVSGVCAKISAVLSL